MNLLLDHYLVVADKYDMRFEQQTLEADSASSRISPWSSPSVGDERVATFRYRLLLGSMTVGENGYAGS